MLYFGQYFFIDQNICGNDSILVLTAVAWGVKHPSDILLIIIYDIFCF